MKTKQRNWTVWAVVGILSLVLYSGTAIAQDGGSGLGTRDRLHDQIQDRIQDCLDITMLAGDLDQDRLRTRDRLRDCDLQTNLAFRPTSVSEGVRHRNEVRNEFRYEGIASPASLILLVWTPLGLF